MRLDKKLLLTMIMTVSYSASASNNYLVDALANYNSDSKKCSAFRIFPLDLKVNDIWFNNLSNDQRKTAAFVALRDLLDECMYPVDNALIVGMFKHAASTGDNRALLNHVKMEEITLRHAKDSEVQAKIKSANLDKHQLNRFISKLKSDLQKK